jgi:hypothetical protein
VLQGKVFDERGREADRQRPEQALLVFDGEAHERFRSDGRIEPSQERDGVFPARFGDQALELLGRPLVHDARFSEKTNIFVRRTTVEWISRNDA